MRKKIITLSLVAAMGCMLAACGSFGKKSVSNDYITVENYNNLEIAKVEETKISDDDVDSTVESNVEASKELKTVKRAAKSGDVVNIDYVGTVKGKEFDGGSSEGYDLELGSNTFIAANGKYKGFEDQIIGHKKGDKFTITVKFPKDYSSEDLAGKVAKFKITVNKVQEYTEPKLNDEWVKANSDTSKTVAEYKKEIKKQLEDEQSESNQDTLRKEALEALSKQITVKKVPTDEVKEIKETITSQYENYATMYGMEFADFVEQLMGMTEDQFDEQAEKAAESSAESYMACELIADKESLTPTKKEYASKEEEMATEYGFSSKDEFIEQYGEEDIKKTILQEVVEDYLVEHAKQVDASELTTEAAETTTAAAESTTAAAESTTAAK